MIASESAYREAERWFKNTGQQATAELSGTPTKWFWDRQATVLYHKVTHVERMQRRMKLQRLGQIGLQMGAGTSLRDKRTPDRKKRKEARREE